MLAQYGWTWRNLGSKFSDRTYNQKDICSYVSPPDKLPLCQRTAEGEKGCL